MIKKATVLIIEAGRHGGDLSNIFESTANYADNVNAWTLKRKMQTMPYVAIFYFSVFIFLFIIIIISNMMFAPMSEMSSNGISFIKPVLTTEQSRRVFLHTALLESVFGGLIAGKINEDTYHEWFKTCNGTLYRFRSSILSILPINKQYISQQECNYELRGSLKMNKNQETNKSTNKNSRRTKAIHHESQASTQMLTH